ncbi:hypothetical protein JCM24511_00456 [Saitozyma sp. JCM 24511]|nr:hypothetical protein JCM24511_00456 [Saitozyma sp. JCM 24511]
MASVLPQTEFPGIALITGAGGTGIGSAVAHAFIRAGCTKLILTDLNSSTLDFTQLSLNALSSKSGLYTTILTLAGDISDPAFVDHLFAQIKERFGRLDYAVNCAGISGNNKPSAESSVADFDRITGVNYRGLWLCSRKELEMMQSQQIREREGYAGVRRQRGSIVNIASQLGVVGRPDAPIYCASKSAVIGLTRCDAIDYSKHLIRVNAVCPGIIDTPMTQPRQPGSSGADAGFGGPAVPLPAGMSNEAGLRQNPMDITRAVGIAPMDRKGTTDEIADVVLFLCSEKASFVQGAAWVVDGGYTIN